jgi:RNA polymerase sigma-70 factor (ECF subfamily)
MTSVLSAVLAVLVAHLVSHPGGSTIRGRTRAAGRREVGRGVGRAPRPEVLDDAPVRVAGPVGVDGLDDLVERARSGDVEAFGELFDRFHGPIFGQLVALTRSRALAEDLTSETFFRALRAMGAFSLPPRLFGPWLGRIARNLANDHFKASRTRLEVMTPDLGFHEEVAASPEDLLIQSLDHQALRDAMSLLPTNQRRAVELRFLRQLSITETAAWLGCTEGAAKQLQWRGLRNLAALLGDEVRRS